MKEAAGEANMTVITIVLIGIVAAVGAVFIPRLLTNLKAKSCCMEYGGHWEDAKCVGGSFDQMNMGQIKLSPSCK